ncbi:putative protein phosphatase 2C 60 [Gossypium australe]|uniref:PPM-type phosphatase domain-containing protein n=1 Tax=Gossypium australe TaxID=47621 RepID=A0A5B6W9H0_9ROSI|nr:putative protein phosphatase 2C 60 [Gossypium australe]
MYDSGPHSDFDGPTQGSTACVAIIRNKQLIVANAGDSRCVISRKGQGDSMGFIPAPFQILLPLSPLNMQIGDVEFKQNKTLPAEKQIVTANPDINAVELCDDDEFLVLACDGIWDCMSSQQLVDYVREQLSSEPKLSAICERVFDRCLAPTAGGEGCDNMTMILVQFKRPVDSGTLEEQQEQQLLTDQTATIDKSASGSGSGPELESGS